MVTNPPKNGCGPHCVQEEIEASLSLRYPRLDGVIGYGRAERGNRTGRGAWCCHFDIGLVFGNRKLVRFKLLWHLRNSSWCGIRSGLPA